MTFPSSHPFAGVVFDMDGTLVDSMASVARTWRALVAEMGVDVEPSALAHGVPSESTIAALLPHADDEESAKWVRRHIQMELADVDGTVPVPGAGELLAYLDEIHVPWGIATSCSSALAEARLAITGLPRPDVFFAMGRDYTRAKPDPEPFSAAAAALGLAGKPFIVIEDAPAGITSGKSAGAFVVGVTFTHDAAALAEADNVVESLLDLRLWLEREGMFTLRPSASPG